MPVRFVLASSSPARLSTLQRAGVRPEVIVSGVDESVVTADTTAELVVRLATLKAQAVFAGLDGLGGPALVLGCDSMLDIDGVALGKPADRDDALARWHAMRGRAGVLHTGHALITPNGAVGAECGSTVVHFADVTDDEIARYCATGEPLAVAGAFTLDGLGGWFVERVEGDPHNVVGLSLPILRRMLHDLGLGLAELGYPGS